MQSSCQYSLNWEFKLSCWCVFGFWTSEHVVHSSTIFCILRTLVTLLCNEALMLQTSYAVITNIRIEIMEGSSTIQQFQGKLAFMQYQFKHDLALSACLSWTIIIFLINSSRINICTYSLNFYNNFPNISSLSMDNYKKCISFQ